MQFVYFNLEMGIKPNPNQTSTHIFQQNEPNEPELFDTPNPNWSNWTEPELYAVGSIYIYSVGQGIIESVHTGCISQVQNVLHDVS